MIDIYRAGEKLCRVRVADSFISRLKGLMFKKGLPPDEGLLIRYASWSRSRGVHGFFMRFPIDLIFIDGNKKVVEKAKLHPWRLYTPVSNCSWVLELNEGFSKEKKLKVGDQLTF